MRPTLRDRLRATRRRMRALLRRSDTDREMSAELAFHIEMETEQNVRAGLDPESARRAALVAFGGVARVEEEVREVRGIGVFDDFMQDLRHAARSFRRTPGFAAAAIGALALGIGANTAVFSVLYGVVLAPLPYPEPHRLVRLWERNPAQQVERGAMSAGTFVDLRVRSRTLERLALYGERDMFVTDGRGSWETRVVAVSPTFFDVLGVHPIIGGAFPPDDVDAVSARRDDVAIIGYALWQRYFGGSADVVGKTIRLENRWTYTVVGVMPEGFEFPAGAQIWTALSYGRSVTMAERQFRYYRVIGRVRAGHTIEGATRETAAIAAQLESEYPASNKGWSVEVARLDHAIVGGARTALVLVFCLALCVLLIASANVATLVLARAAARRHETAVRTALGASAGRLLRQSTAEALLLAVLGGAAGVLVGYWSSRLLLSLAPPDIPRLDTVGFGGWVLAFAALATVVTALAIGVLPMLARRDAATLDALRTRTIAGALSGTRARAWLLGGQVALTFVLTVAALLLARSFARLRGTDLGFARANTYAVELRVPLGRFTSWPPWLERIQYYDRLLDDLARLPGLSAVAGTTNIPLTGEMGSGSLWRTDAPGAHGSSPPTSAGDQSKAAIQIVTPLYFETMRIRLLRGRLFDDRDRFPSDAFNNMDGPRPPGVAIVNETMARRVWPGADPLGKSIVVFDDRSFAASRTIIGIARDVRAESVDSPPEPTVYLPFAQHPGRALALVVQSNLPVADVLRGVTGRVHAFDRTIILSRLLPLDAVIGGSLSRPRFTMLLASAFAGLALVIAALGVFGIVGYLVTRRTQEIGIRMALGARAASVLRLVLTDGLRPVLLGIAVGSLAAVGVAQAMRTLLYGLAPLDAPSFVAAAVLLLAASMIAAIVPARRAASVDPLRALRND